MTKNNARTRVQGHRESRHIHTFFTQPPCNDGQPVQGQRARGENSQVSSAVFTAYLEDLSSPGGCFSPFDVNLSK